MKALVMGSGAIGGTVAGYLARDGRDVSVVDPWFNHINAIKESGLWIRSTTEEFVVQLPAYQMDELERLGRYEVIVLGTKSYDTTWMTRLAREHLADGGVVVSTQNGMNEEPIGDIIGRERVIGCVIEMGAEVFTPGLVRRTSGDEWGSLVIGEVEPARNRRLDDLAEYLSPLRRVRVAEDIQGELWGKLALNTISNAVAGLCGLTTKGLWTNPNVLDILVALGHEVALVASAAGVTLAPTLHRVSHDQWLAATDTEKDAWQQIRQEITAVGETRTGERENIPSLLQDIMKGRRSEVDYFNGWIAERGREFGIATPANEMIIDQLRPVEIGSTKPAVENAKDLSAAVAEWYGRRD
jgi:2-dehydropantoate 2-reductase